ncbi:MAG: hypothetical protein AVDCRST_MAG58-4030, partial [uncultured Rubrobacteraceae bacterium]
EERGERGERIDREERARLVQGGVRQPRTKDGLLHGP